jgi:tol-pal system protein YbgF
MKAVLLPVLCLAAALAPLVLTACAHQSAEDLQLAGMETEVNRIQIDRDRADQPFLDETAPLAAKAPPVTPSGSNPPPAVGMRAVQLGDEGGEGSGPEVAAALDGEDPSDTTPRPSIRVEGASGTRRGARVPERVEETLPDEAPNGGSVGPSIRANAPAPSALDEGAHRAYDAALALVNAHQFDKALDAFAGFLVKWPDHPNADNAMYWRGECYYAKGEFLRAAEEFEGTLARFPLGNKVPDALLKLGICQQKLGNPAKAKTYFERLLRDFPRSEAARRIPGAESSTRGAGPQENP